MNLNTTNWKGFAIERLFKLENGKANQGMLGEGNDCFYVGAKKDDNGVMIHCMKDNALMQKGNCIIFICNGQGSVGYANYMDVDFIGTTDIVAGYNENLNSYNGLFIATVLCQERPKYSFGRKWKTHLKSTIIKLPIKCNPDGTPYIDNTFEYSDYGYVPNWKWMENYIKSLHHKPLTTKNKKKSALQHNICNWQEFIVGNLFKVELSKGDIKIDDVDKGNVPLISSGENNNGIVGYIDKNGDGKAEIFKGNKITIDMFGNPFYQKDDFYAVSHGRVNILNPKFELNETIGIFISSVIKKEQYKFSYGRAVYSTEAANMIIELPIQYNPDGTPFIDEAKKYSEKGYVPDWNFMDNYIKSLPYGDRI